MKVNKTASLTYSFAEKIVSADPLKCEEAVIQAQYGIIDYLAASFAGSKDEGVHKLISIMEEEGGREIAPVIGHKKRFSELQAALINGFSGHVLDFDDVHSEVRGHPSTVILPTFISIAASGRVTGRKLLASYIIGVEVMARLGKAIGSNHYLRGFHNTSTLGTIAAAVAAAYLKGFTALDIAKVIGFAATQASGLRVQFGTETKPLHAGLAAQAAIKAVKFVEHGLNGTISALDGELGFFNVYGEGSHFAEPNLLNDWGKTWRIVNPGLWFKIYPFCSATHHAAEAALDLRKYEVEADNIKEIIVIFPTKGDAALIQRHPKTGEQGRFSVEYVVALALKGYPLTLSNFQKVEIAEDIQKLIAKTRRVYDDSIVPAANSVPSGRFTIVRIITEDGEQFEARVDCPKGAAGNPLSRTELELKLKQSVMSHELTEKLLKEISKLSTTDNLKELLDLLI